MTESSDLVRPLYTAYPLHDALGWMEPIARAALERGVGADDYLDKPERRRMVRLASRLGLIRNYRRGSRTYLGVAAHASLARCFPRIYGNEFVLLAMDCWEPRWDAWEQQFRRARCRVACFSARQSADEMARRIPGLETIWMPEGIDLEPFGPTPPLASRSIDVLQTGRLHQTLHEGIERPLASAGARYVHPAGGRVFGTREELLAGLGDTKVFICYPRCDTHPERAGSVETLTLRYLEGFASRCIVAGRAPQELIDLFGYDPVVPIDPLEDPARKLWAILGDVEHHQSLVDRNYKMTVETATWDTRVGQMLQRLRELGYVPAGELQETTCGRPEMG